MTWYHQTFDADEIAELGRSWAQQQQSWHLRTLACATLARWTVRETVCAVTAGKGGLIELSDGTTDILIAADRPHHWLATVATNINVQVKPDGTIKLHHSRQTWTIRPLELTARTTRNR